MAKVETSPAPMSAVTSPDSGSPSKLSPRDRFTAEAKRLYGRGVTAVKDPNFWFESSRVYNGATAAFVLGSFVKNKYNGVPADVLEYLPDTALHAWQTTIDKRASKRVQQVAVALNTARLAQIAYHAVRHNSTISNAVNYLDIGNHILNFLALAYIYQQQTAKSAGKSDASPSATVPVTPAADAGATPATVR